MWSLGVYSLENQLPNVGQLQALCPFGDIRAVDVIRLNLQYAGDVTQMFLRTALAKILHFAEDNILW